MTKIQIDDVNNSSVLYRGTRCTLNHYDSLSVMGCDTEVFLGQVVINSGRACQHVTQQSQGASIQPHGGWHELASSWGSTTVHWQLTEWEGFWMQCKIITSHPVAVYLSWLKFMFFQCCLQLQPEERLHCQTRWSSFNLKIFYIISLPNCMKGWVRR